MTKLALVINGDKSSFLELKREILRDRGFPLILRVACALQLIQKEPPSTTEIANLLKSVHSIRESGGYVRTYIYDERRIIAFKSKLRELGVPDNLFEIVKEERGRKLRVNYYVIRFENDGRPVGEISLFHEQALLKLTNEGPSLFSDLLTFVYNSYAASFLASIPRPTSLTNEYLNLLSGKVSEKKLVKMLIKSLKLHRKALSAWFTSEREMTEKLISVLDKLYREVTTDNLDIAMASNIARRVIPEIILTDINEEYYRIFEMGVKSLFSLVRISNDTFQNLKKAAELFEGWDVFPASLIYAKLKMAANYLQELLRIKNLDGEDLLEALKDFRNRITRGIMLASSLFGKEFALLKQLKTWFIKCIIDTMLPLNRLQPLASNENVKYIVYEALKLANSYREFIGEYLYVKAKLLEGMIKGFLTGIKAPQNVVKYLPQDERLFISSVVY